MWTAPFKSAATQGGTMKRSAMAAIVLMGSLATLLMFCGAVSAQTTKVNGVITGRSGSGMTLQTSSEPKLEVVLTDDTQVAQVQGVFKARRKEMSMAALIPGLQDQAEGPTTPNTNL